MVCTSLLLGIAMVVYSQKSTIADLKRQLSSNIKDTARVELLRKLSMQIQPIRADSALLFAHQGLDLARKLNYKTGEGNCLNRIGVVLWKNGNYAKALSFLLASLKVREDANDRLGELKSLNDIGIIYADQKDYTKALTYHYKAKTLAELFKDNRNLSIIFSNIGNCYIKLGKIDSALSYEMEAYEIQHSLNDQDNLPNTLSILGDIHLKMGQASLALEYYRLSILNAKKNNDQTNLADTYNSLARFYFTNSRTDSSIYYATNALKASQAANYPEGIYNASSLLSKIYQGHNDHLELVNFKIASAAHDSMFNAEKVKEVQTLSFNESARQQEIQEERRREAEQRIINLQLAGIAIFIPFLFLLLLLLSKSRIHRKVIDFMTVLSLLFVFEFITLFVHPFVLHFSNHLPAIELLIMVLLATVLVPLHHRLTLWLREKLAHAPHENRHAPVNTKAPKKMRHSKDRIQ